MPDIVKTWYTIANQSVSAGTNPLYKADMLFTLKNALVGGISARNPSDVLVSLGALAGTVVESSDSATAASSDLIVASANLVWDIAGNNHSWFVLEFTDFYSVGNHQYMLFDCRGTNEGLAYISFARGVYTGGNVTNAPTATNEVVVKDGVTAVGNLSVSDCWDGEDTASLDGVLHVQVSADGECFRWFHCRSGTLHTFAGFQRVQRTPTSGMTNDATFWWISGDTDANAIVWATLSPLTPFYVLTNALATRTGTVLGVVYGAGNTSITTQTANAHDNSRWLPEVALYFTSPLGVQSVLPDMWWASAGDPVGSKAPTTNEIFAQVGEMMIPWPLDRVFTSS